MLCTPSDQQSCATSPSLHRCWGVELLHLTIRIGGTPSCACFVASARATTIKMKWSKIPCFVTFVDVHQGTQHADQKGQPRPSTMVPHDQTHRLHAWEGGCWGPSPSTHAASDCKFCLQSLYYIEVLPCFALHHCSGDLPHGTTKPLHLTRVFTA